MANTMNHSETKNATPESQTKQYTIGIPRGLLFYKYGPLWHSFLKKLGCKVVYSTITTDEIVKSGSKDAVSELCVPVKTYMGHVKALIEEYGNELDYIFIPRYVCTKENQYFCPKFMIMPEVIRHRLKPTIPIITLEANSKKRTGIESAINFAAELGITDERISGEAWYWAIQDYSRFKKMIRKGNSVIDYLDGLDDNPKHKRQKSEVKSRVPEQNRGKFPINILVLGHAYNVYEENINMGLVHRLKEYDCNVMTLEKLPKEVFEKRVLINKQYMNYWENEEEILQTARYYITQTEQSIDGCIFLISFACGPDSLVQELLMRDLKSRNIPYLDLILDEHTGKAGLITRVESFVDMIRRQKYKDMNN